MTVSSVIVSTGGYLPEKVVTNAELAAQIETTDDWITTRVGVKERRFAQDGEMASDLGAKAALDALSRGKTCAEDIDLIVVATTTADQTFPSTATIIQAKIGATKAFAFDVQAVCSGFLYALDVADSMIKARKIKKALVIGTETMSRIVDPKDRATAVIFGDGAGAVLVEAQENTNQGILSTHLFSDGTFKDLLYVNGGPGCGQFGYMYMAGKEIFKLAVEKLGSAIETALDHNKIAKDQIDWFIPHQANYRIINALAEHFDLPPEKVVVTIDTHGNTSAASIPLALHTAVSDGRIKRGDLLVFEAMGGGLTWGSALIRW
ncbi:MAG: ketoacyl-ACP synthase III [Candidatus Paracaedibacteraceae bacterium]|nr:ketoacyl-ACP synthase III [Candidatus Paracaedibacteraceae bacterium]